MADVKELLAREGIPVAEERLDLIRRYQEMLIDWNSRMDLTSVPPEEMAARHFLDSLLPLREGKLIPASASLIDVGTGAGFPGLALAAARPDLRVTLLEAQGKRCQFLNAVKEELGLDHVRVIQERAEVLGRHPDHREQYDLAVARAVAGLNVLCEYLLPFVRVRGQALCWKGPAVLEEMADGQAAAEKLGGAVLTPVEMCSEALEGKHLLVPIQKMEKTVSQYPRKNGIPSKRPLKAEKK
ncbi:MAG: 16S rRNA (guanine(527)-N(7))-methyltransferase RsmG [Clostridia bacterium]|nr:16S rRNA (guanine(527)-N(7))-methyltransferase RsmG [Clostridia bacterium]